MTDERKTPSTTLEIEDHALIGDLSTAALVARDGTIDFLCLPDFDSDGCFLSLLGDESNGCWKIAPRTEPQQSRRQYRGDTLILETEFETESGAVRLIDFMPIRAGAPRVVRIVQGLRGKVPMRSELVPRFSHGLTIPRDRPLDGVVAAMAGPDGIFLRVSGDVAPALAADFSVEAGSCVSFVMAWAPPYEDIPPAVDADQALRETAAFWTDWSSKLHVPNDYSEVVKRLLLTLKACCFAKTGAIVAAPTFGLPEAPGGSRNWDYRFCWLRDASLTLGAMQRAGLDDEAKRFFRWLMDAVGGAPSQLQIMYGIRGERRLTEVELDWLGGYGGARPVRIGNGAYNQFQLDVFGEFAHVLHTGAQNAGRLPPEARAGLKTAATSVEANWLKPDHGIWEMRGPNRSFTSSKVSAWMAIDRWVRSIEEFGLDEDAAPWIRLRQDIFDEVCAKGFDPIRNTFTQYYGSKGLDGSLLAIPLSGFLPATDPRVIGTVAAIEKELMPQGLVLRYQTEETDDGLTGVEGVFLPCSFWLASTYQLMGRHQDARTLFNKLVGLCNDVGLLAEEYDPTHGRQLGNFPQAFSHLALINCAYTLGERQPPAESPVPAHAVA